MARMIALMAFPYAGRQLEAGEEFDTVRADDEFALAVFGRAESLADDTKPERVPRVKRKYRRRDMHAE